MFLKADLCLFLFLLHHDDKTGLISSPDSASVTEKHMGHKYQIKQIPFPRNPFKVCSEKKSKTEHLFSFIGSRLHRLQVWASAPPSLVSFPFYFFMKLDTYQTCAMITHTHHAWRIWRSMCDLLVFLWGEVKHACFGGISRSPAL